MNADTLFPLPPLAGQVGRHDLGQYMTPDWAAQALVDQFLPDLSTDDCVLEPTCGRGSFLKAVPEQVRAFGIELDPQLADQARRDTGRPIITGDFRQVELPELPTAIIGNPPFSMPLLNQLLDRAHDWLPNNGRCGLIISTHMVQTPNTVLRWCDRWSLDQRILPRTLFPRAIRPLVFMMFTKDRVRGMLGGFALYRESADVNAMSRPAKLLLVHGKPGGTCWRSVVDWALRQLGGTAKLSELYQAINPHRPTENQWWQAKVRQTLQRHFHAVERGVWSLTSEAV